MSPMYTRTGDDGSTGLLGGKRLPKYHPRLEAVGAVDEASAALGLARASCQAPQTGSILTDIQHDLYAVMAELAAVPENVERYSLLEKSRLQWLETQTDAISELVPTPRDFILPGDTLAGAALGLARTAVRRAERRVAELLDNGEIENTLLLKYLNRLSSLCFALELLEDYFTGRTPTKAKK